MDSRDTTDTNCHSLIQSLVSALEARDAHTAEHSLRVAGMTGRLLKLMKLPADMARQVHSASYVHDIGKIALPDQLLHRTSRLTADGQQMLRDHVRVGAQILARCPSLEPLVPVVLHHHERWDGSGFPDGLTGEEIPLGARIVTVCDAVDAMLGRPSHKSTYTQQECRDQLQCASGASFDPGIVAVLLQHWDEIVGPVDFTDSPNQAAPHTISRDLACEVPPDPSLFTGTTSKSR